MGPDPRGQWKTGPPTLPCPLAGRGCGWWPRRTCRGLTCAVAMPHRREVIRDRPWFGRKPERKGACLRRAGNGQLWINRWKGAPLVGRWRPGCQALRSHRKETKPSRWRNHLCRPKKPGWWKSPLKLLDRRNGRRSWSHLPRLPLQPPRLRRFPQSQQMHQLQRPSPFPPRHPLPTRARGSRQPFQWTKGLRKQVIQRPGWPGGRRRKRGHRHRFRQPVAEGVRAWSVGDPPHRLLRNRPPARSVARETLKGEVEKGGIDFGFAFG